MSRVTPSPDSSTSKKGFKQAFRRPFFGRRPASSGSTTTSKHLTSRSSSPTQAAQSSHPDPDTEGPTSADLGQHGSSVRWKDHATDKSDDAVRSLRHPKSRRQSNESHDSKSSSSSQDGAGGHSERTPLGNRDPLNYFGSALGTPTPTLGAAAPISSLHFVQTLNALLLEPATLALTQLAPPSVLAIPWAESPYGASGLSAPSSTSLSTYISQASAAHSSSAAASVTNPQTYGCNEQLAASALSLPSVSVAALWRAISCMQWINESADTFCQSIDDGEPTSYMDAKDPNLVHAETIDVEGVTSPSGWPTHKKSVFEIGGLLQNLMDVLSSTATKHDVELVLYHGRDPMADPPQSEFRPEGGLRELHCKGDDTGLGTAIMAIVCKILQKSQPGDTIEVGLSLTCLATNPDLEGLGESNLSSPRPHKSASIRSQLDYDEEDEEESTPWEATLDISHSCAPDVPELLEPADPFARDPLVQLLAKGTGISINPIIAQSPTRRSWPVSIKLQQTVPPAPPPDPPASSGSSQRPKHLAELTKEPSVTDLIRFADTFLRGKKAVIHSAEKSLFAKHMTGYLAMWGLHPTHVPLETPLREEDDHGDGVFARPDVHPRSQPQSPPLDPTVNFIFIDDDISTLRRQLVVIKNSAPQLQLPSTLLNKRPGLQSRRTRSSAHIKPSSSQSPTTNSHLAVIYCTSLSKFRFIRELVQSIFRSVSPAFPLPEVFVLPKPVGPRRLLTALHTSIKKPFLDSAVLPIATSPSSPGGHFFVSPSTRPSPAPSNHQDFDSAFGAHAHAVEQSTSFATPRTPPYVPAPLAPAPPATNSNVSPSPPSPRTSSSEAVEYLEYMSKTTKDLGGDSSSGIVIQSQDGKAQGLYFHPKRNSMSQNMGSISRPTRLSADFTRLEPQNPAELTEFATKEDDNSSPSPTHDPAPDISSTPPNPSAILHVSDSPVTPDRSEFAYKPAEQSEGEVPPPSLPAVAPMTGGPGESMPPSSAVPTSIMSPPLEAGDRALPLDSFTPITRLAAPGRSVSDNIVPVTPVSKTIAAAPPSLNRTITAPAVPLSQTNSNSLPKVGREEATPPLTSSPSVTPAPQTSATSPKNATPSKPPTTAQVAPGSQSDHVSTIAGPPAAILARSAGRKPKLESNKSKRRAGTPVVPPVNVLIVEDNRIEQVVVSTFLRRHGIRCSVAADGQEAVDKWKTGGFHLVLMDIQLPVKSGMEATMEIRELERANNIAAFQMTPTTEGTPGTMGSQADSSAEDQQLATGLPPSAVSAATSPHQLPVIIVALTASSLPADRISALAAGCNDFITKPVSHKWLHQKVLEWGSMSYLSSFKRYKTPATSPASTLLRAGLGFDRTAAENKAKEIAASLHIDRKPRDSSSDTSVGPSHGSGSGFTGSSPGQQQQVDAPPKGSAEPPLSRPELSTFKPGSSGSIPKMPGSPQTRPQP